MSQSEAVSSPVAESSLSGVAESASAPVAEATSEPSVSESAAAPPSTSPASTTEETKTLGTDGDNDSATDPFADPTSPIEGPLSATEDAQAGDDVEEDSAGDDEDEAADEDEEGESEGKDDEEEELEEALFWHDQIIGELRRVCRDGGDTGPGAYHSLTALSADRWGNRTYTARAERTGETVAVKVMRLTAPVPRLAGQRLIAELFLVRDMRPHANILSFLDLYLVQDQEVWLVTEHLKGGLTLEELIAYNHAAFTEERMARICLETCKGLAHLHEQLILHRDIRSASLVVSPAGRVKITAFTFAAQLPSAAAKRRTMVSTLALPTTHSHYTPDKTHWTPPEVIRRQPYGPEVDVWALGITLLEMIDGGPPHLGADPLKVLFLILVGGAPAPQRAVSAALAAFVRGCVEVDVEARRGVDELLEDEWLEGACAPAELAPLFEWPEDPEDAGDEGQGGDASAEPSAEAVAPSDPPADPDSLASPPEAEAGDGSSEDAPVLGSTAPRGAGSPSVRFAPPPTVPAAEASAEAEAAPEDSTAPPVAPDLEPPNPAPAAEPAESTSPAPVDAEPVGPTAPAPA
ncbi:kinase-like domain-containing protein [Mycena maculata]|uniref:Kinase-like domain-containing protein n=1 Tax=Mycena maculata TaxID=230809 RepID=A0AAD7HER3_9AGAR|nr:kinase-like domain-containing protein [Mycena maculata]